MWISFNYDRTLPFGHLRGAIDAEQRRVHRHVRGEARCESRVHRFSTDRGQRARALREE